MQPLERERLYANEQLIVTRASENREVVITGMGVVSPIGIGVNAFWESLSTGRSGIGYSKMFPGVAAPDGVGAEVRDFTDESARKVYLKEQRKNLKAMCREIQLGVASASLALQDAIVDLEQIDHERLGVEFGANLMLSPPEVLLEGCAACCEEGTDHFQSSRWGQSGLTKLEPLWLLRYLPNMPACHISISADARGPSNSLTLDDASGNTVIGEAMRILLRGDADIMITGVTGTTLHPIKTLHLASLERSGANTRSSGVSGLVPLISTALDALSPKAHAHSSSRIGGMRNGAERKFWDACWELDLRA